MAWLMDEYSRIHGFQPACCTGKPLALASALEKIENIAERAPLNVNPSYAHLYIVNPMGGDKLRWVAALFRTHPLTKERVARLEAMAYSDH